MGKPKFMLCGHSANAFDSAGNPTCVICVGIIGGATKLALAPDLVGRLAYCTYYPRGGKCGECPPPVPSDLNLAFFSYNRNSSADSYYCGCWGWD